GGELGAGRDAEGVWVAVQVEAVDRGEAHTLVQLGPGGACEDLDAVAERDELAGQVPRVDALAPAPRVAPVDEKGDAPAPWGRRPRGDPLGHDERLGASPRRPRLSTGLARGFGHRSRLLEDT